MEKMAWYEELRSRYSSGMAQVFLLHGNVGDYVNGGGFDLRGYLSAMFQNRLRVVYNRAEGLTFPDPNDRKRFIELAIPQAAQAAMAGLSEITGNAPGEMPLPRDPLAALPLLEGLLKQVEIPAVVVMDYLETIAGAHDFGSMSPEDRTVLVHLQRWAKDAEVLNAGHPILLIAANVTDIAPPIRAASSRIHQLEIPLPSVDDRQAYLERTGAEYEEGLDAEKMARLTAGLTRVHLEDIVLQARFADEPVSLDLVKSRKQEIIRGEFEEVLELQDPEFGFAAIGGLEHVKQFFRRSVIEPMKTGNTGRVPQGVLMIGPAGTGKSVMAQAVAKEAGVNCVTLNPAKIFGSYVGQSERNLEKALRCVEQMAPTVVFIDEIDQSVQRNTGGGDSGVSARVFKRLLEFMADTSHRGKVIFLAASNRPDIIDPALKRPGRFDKKIPFLAPDETERTAIVTVLAAKSGLTAVAPEEIAQRTDGWTGAELEALTIKALEVLQDEGLTPMGAYEQALTRYRPTTADVELMTLLAIEEVNDTDLLPASYRHKLSDRKKLQEEVAEKKAATELRGRGKRDL